MIKTPDKYISFTSVRVFVLNLVQECGEGIHEAGGRVVAGCEDSGHVSH